MSSYYPGQRWSSEAEPELGIGIVLETSKGRVKLHFPLSGATRLYAAENAPLRRLRFKVGDTIADTYGRTMVVEHVQETEETITYFGQGRNLPESDLGNVAVRHNADERLLIGQIDDLQAFALRRRTLQYDHRRRISETNGFLGGRIDLIPHQLYIAREVSARFAPRVLLSDEVGLGKTIEACLILHRLLMSGRISRVLILVPESLVHQWFVELLRRFNLWFHIFDERRSSAAGRSAPDGNPFLDDQLVLCSTAFLAHSTKRMQEAIVATWDMLVVDEAHHLEWTPENPSPEYRMVEALSQATDGLLLLTATPEQLGPESHFARLRLLDPQRFTDLNAFQSESLLHQTTADCVQKLMEDAELTASDLATLENLVGKNAVAAFQANREAVRLQLIQDLLDRHGPGRVVFRNRRATMSGFPIRMTHLAPLKQVDGQTEGEESLVAEFLMELHPSAPTKQPDFSLDSDPRLLWLLGLMEEIDPAKVLLICSRKEKVLALETALRKHVRFKVGVFHEDLSLVQRDRNAAWFAEPDGARILLCSEIGSEGRNFQFALHLVLFDLPLLPELLEQRVGRLDRIGQREDIHIHVPYMPGSPQEAFVRWYHEGLNAFAQNLEGGHRIAAEFRERMVELALHRDAIDFEARLAQLIADTQAFGAALDDTMAKGRDRLLEWNSFRPEPAQQLIAQILSEDQSPMLEAYMLHVWEYHSIEIEDLAPRTYLLHALPGSAFPQIPEGGVAATFDRKRALGREEMLFLTWDHPMVSGAIDTILSTGTGGAAYGVIHGKGPSAMLMEALFVVETAAAENHAVNRFLPKTPIRIVIDHVGRDVTTEYPAEFLDQNIRPGDIETILDNEMLVETMIPNLVAAATRIAEAIGAKETDHALQRMQDATNREFSRLVSLQEKNKAIRPVEIQLATAAQQELQDLIRGARVRLEAVQLIQKLGNLR